MDQAVNFPEHLLEHTGCLKVFKIDHIGLWRSHYIGDPVRAQFVLIQQAALGVINTQAVVLQDKCQQGLLAGPWLKPDQVIEGIFDLC